MAPDGVETSVVRNATFPESAHVDFLFDTLGMHILKLIFCMYLLIGKGQSAQKDHTGAKKNKGKN